MTHLTTIQRKTWSAILQDESHPWFMLAEQATKRDKAFRKAKRMIKKMLKP